MTHHTATTRSGPRFKFIGETIAELKKVVWLSRQQAIYLTVLVLALSAIAGLLLGVIDYGFTRFVNVLLGGG